MHGAPSVSYPVGRSPLAGLLLLAGWALGAAACAAWAWQGAAGWRLAVAAAACPAAGAWAAWAWLRQPAGSLAWDGSSWAWSAGGQGAEGGGVRVALDLQVALLLRWRAGRRSGWFWVERASLPGRWDALRRAV